MTIRPPKLALATLGVTLAVFISISAYADRDYRGSAYARTSGNTCRDTASSNLLSFTAYGMRNSSGTGQVVRCPIIRRNSTPYGKKERADGLTLTSAPGFTPTSKIDRLDVEIWFTPQTLATNCFAYGRNEGSSGSSFFSSTLATCTTSTGCSATPRSQTLSWANPFGTSRPFINVGYRCVLQNNATIVGSVASFSGDFIAIP